MKIAVFCANYNMPEKADALWHGVMDNTKADVDFYLVDNASDLVPPAKNTNVFIKDRNRQTTAAWLTGLQTAKEAGVDYFAYVFCITSASISNHSGDVISPLLGVLQDDENAVGVHPALTLDSTTSWTHLITRGGYKPRKTWMIDNIFSMYRADWFDSIGWFDSDLRYAWGIDLETCWKARLEKRSLWVQESVQIRKVTDIAYSMNRMNMTADERRKRAGENMAIVLEHKYGPHWWDAMTKQNVTEDML